ncbi:hypothetical protein GOP47_0003387 [Adiantum capillus-veneris]|uniref:F-box domain-containing protein n=1 Tax=Adiantum capillus-veneris TaxID=13818 RepID=A0A9D4VCP6_ADICA|nr:hypothetical protein GOP47_0003387 [Adiantum capillus-veneris]
MDSLPVEVTGRILSCVASARHVVMASAISQKWQEAAKHHLRRLTFNGSDFSTQEDDDFSPSMCITNTVMRTSSLHELSISVEAYILSESEDESDEDDCEGEFMVELQAASVDVWIQHTKGTLRSLTIMNPITPPMNILEKLGNGESNLKQLEWGSAHIPVVNPAIHVFQSLSSLTLFGMQDWLAVSNLEALLLACPKLVSLSLVDVKLWEYLGRYNPPPMAVTLKSSSLKAVHIDQGFELIDDLILHIDCLESLSLEHVSFELVKLVQNSRHGGLQHLSIIEAHIWEMELGDLASGLYELRLHGRETLEADWKKLYPMFSRAINLRKLYLPSNTPNIDEFDVGFDKIAKSFPNLYLLGLNYRPGLRAFKAGGSAEALTFGSVTILELTSWKPNKEFAAWIAGFLEHCPNLKQLTTACKVSDLKPGDSGPQSAEFNKLMSQILQPYPHVATKYVLSLRSKVSR